jgi:arsenical pump membrane protein
VPEGVALALALVVLAATLAVAVARPPYLSEAVAAAAGAVLLLAVGAVGWSGARDAMGDLGPTIGFLAALLLIADGCRRAGLFEALGAVMARGARASPRRLLAFVFAVAAAVTAVLSLDATVVLLTPVVFATAARMRTSPRPHVYACSHLANTASLLLPVSNLTNCWPSMPSTCRSSASRPSWSCPPPPPWASSGRCSVVARRARAGAVMTSAPAAATHTGAMPTAELAAKPASVRARTTSGKRGSAGAASAWAGAGRGRPRSTAKKRVPALARAAEPGFLVFVLGLGIIVRAAGENGLDDAVRALLPGGSGLGDLLLVAIVSAVLANVVNNLPATLVLVPIAAGAGTGPVLAVLLGVNIGPNLTYVGSLATLLWRRVLHAQDTDVDIGEFARLGALTVPAGILAATVLLWLALQV